jgi:hypothetical protein
VFSAFYFVDLTEEPNDLDMHLRGTKQYLFGLAKALKKLAHQALAR